VWANGELGGIEGRELCTEIIHLNGDKGRLEAKRIDSVFTTKL